MSVTCPITVQFEVRDEAGLFALAVRHRDRMLALDREGDERDRDACRMLEHAAEARGVARGPKGDMFTWGSVGNYSSADTFVGALRPFIEDLWRERVIFDFHTVVVMFQQEQMGTGHVFELSLDQTPPRDGHCIVVRDLERSFPLFESVWERPEQLLPRGVRTRTWGDGQVALSDCERCWSTPCHCGHDYADRPLAWLRKMRDMFARLVAERESRRSPGHDDGPTWPRDSG